MEARVGIEAKIVLVLLSLLDLVVHRFNKIRTLSRCKHKFSTIFDWDIFCACSSLFLRPVVAAAATRIVARVGERAVG